MARNEITWSLLAAAAAACLAWAAPAATAQSSQSSWGSGASYEQRLRCESAPGREQYCAARNDGRVRMIRSYGSTGCAEGSTWRYDAGGVYVRNGCRGEFGFFTPGSGGGGSGWNDAAVVDLRCESRDGRENFCRVANSGVSLMRTESRAPCTQGQTWRYTNDGIYVRDGCRGQFRVRTRAPGDPGWGGSAGGPPPFQIRCQSIGGRWGACPVEIGGPVRLVKKESHAACTRGWTWGTMGSEAIWVSDGCRAIFEVQNGRASAGRKATEGQGLAPPGVTRQKME
jgi:hypothetical protein